jgi:hypothetical protein
MLWLATSGKGVRVPYRHAPYYVLVVMAVIAAGFWPSYFAKGFDVPWQFHAHGVAASIWVTMVFAQSWTAHHKRFGVHAAVGKSSLLLFPFLIAGFAGIIDLTAKGYVAANDPVRVMFGPSFLIGMAVAIAAYVTIYFRALKYRRKVWVHAGYMLATPLFLFESPFSRLLGMVVPAFRISGPDDFPLIMDSIIWSMALELAIIAAIWLKYRERANPFLVTGAFIVAQMVTMGLMGDVAVLKTLLVALGGVPSLAVWLTGFAIGAATSWAGWDAGKRPQASVVVAAARAA